MGGITKDGLVRVPHHHNPGTAPHTGGARVSTVTGSTVIGPKTLTRRSVSVGGLNSGVPINTTRNGPKGK